MNCIFSGIFSVPTGFFHEQVRALPPLGLLQARGVPGGGAHQGGEGRGQRGEEGLASAEKRLLLFCVTLLEP